MIAIDRNVLRFAEAQLAAYSAGLAGLFLLIPRDFAAYEAWLQVMPMEGWGLALLTISLLHVVALRLNGKDARLSHLIRAAACAVHFAIMSSSAIFYVMVEAWWGVLSLTHFSVLASLVGTRTAGVYKYEARNGRP